MNDPSNSDRKPTREERDRARLEKLLAEDRAREAQQRAEREARETAEREARERAQRGSREWREAAERMVESYPTDSPGMERPRIVPEKGPGIIKQVVKRTVRHAKNIAEKTTARVKGVWPKRKVPEDNIGGEQPDIKKELQELSAEKKKKLGFGLKTIGFKVDQMKNNFFATTFGIIESGFTKSTTITNFCRELKESFKRDSKRAYEKGADLRETKAKQLQNIMYLVGTVGRYVRTITDWTGLSLASPLRYVIMAAMATARGTEAAKETRLKSDTVREKTWIQDAEKAAEEAWEIHERASREAGTGKVSAENLQEAYLMQIPKDIAARLQNPQTANHLFQKLIKKQIEVSLERLDKKLKAIDNITQISHEEKEGRKKKLLKSWQEILADYDRIVSQVGTIDVFASSMRYTTKAAQGVVHGLTVETLILSVDKLWETVSRILTSPEAQEVPTTISQQVTPLPTPPPPVETPPATETAGDLRTTLGQTPSQGQMYPPGSRSDALHEHQVGRYPKATAAPSSTPSSIAEIVEGKQGLSPELSSGKAYSPTPPPASPPPVGAPPIAPPAVPVNPDAIIGQDQGIEHAFIRQIKNNEDLAKTLGWNGTEDINKFAGKQAHLIAIKTGYVEGGSQIRIKAPGVVAYELEMKNGDVVVHEKRVDGTLIETNEAGRPFEATPDAHEYKWPKDGAKQAVASLGSTTETPSSIAGIIPTVEQGVPANLGQDVSLSTLSSGQLETEAATAAAAAAEQVREVREALLSAYASQDRSLPSQPPERLPGGRVPYYGERSGYYRPYNPPSPEVIDWAERTRAGAQVTPYQPPHGAPIRSGLIEPSEWRLRGPARGHLVEYYTQSHAPGLSPELLAVVEDVRTDNLEVIFGDRTSVWETLKKVAAVNTMGNTDLRGSDPMYTGLVDYLHKLQEVTGLRPKGSSWFGLVQPETTEQYIARALSRAAELGQQYLESVDLKYLKLPPS